MSDPRVRHIIGCMTGTSLDGLDAALTRITGEGPGMTAELIAMTTRPLGALADVLRSMAGGEAHPPIDYLRAARRLGELHADACAELADAREARGTRGQRHPHPGPLPGGEGAGIDFVVAHGQTIWHAPRDEAGRLSWQLFDPWPVVRRVRVPVCYDLRQADLIAGGQGAPITPIADPILYGGDGPTAVVNLGGICNVTTWSGGARGIEALDLCPCNLLLDGLCRRLTGRPFDRDGALAATAAPSDALRGHIVRHFDLACGDAESLGREQFGPAWIDGLIDQAPDEAPDAPDAPAAWLASAAAWVGETIVADAVGRGAHRIILAGGGARHRTLVGAMTAAAGEGITVQLSDDLGIPCEAREAMAFAVLGALSQDGVAITLPGVTGSKDPGRAGAWVYP